MGLRVAPQEIEILTLWAFQQAAVDRLWVLRADQWGDARADSSLTIAVQLAAPQAGAAAPDTDTSDWEDQLNGLMPPDVSLQVLAPSADAASPGGVEVFRRPKTASPKP